MKHKGNKYDFITKAGNNFKSCISQLYQRVWTSENKPQHWRHTKIVHLYKGKGIKEDLDNIKNLHINDEYSKEFDQLVVNKSKTKMIQKCFKF